MAQTGQMILKVALLVASLLGFISSAQSECDGKCVPLNQCKSNTFGGSLFVNIRVGADDEFAADCDHYLEVCCDKDDVIEHVTDPAIVPGVSDLGAGAPGVGVPGVDDLGAIEYRDCGVRNVNGAGHRITHSTNEAEFGEFPWMVALYSEDMINGLGKKYICGGSLIKPNVVMTAAHCVFNKTFETITARAGEWDTKTENEIRPFQEQVVKRVIVNHHFNAEYLFNDIALLELQHPFVADDHIQTICLPPVGTTFHDKNCFVSGWGKDRIDSDDYQVILKKVELPIVGHSACQSALRTTSLGNKFRLHSSFLCAGGQKDIDACTGDGGSSLVCPIPNHPNKYYQAGIVAWGIGCGQEGIPGVYVKSALYTEWVDEMLQNSGKGEGRKYNQICVAYESG